jgi:hypothetical protein
MRAFLVGMILLAISGSAFGQAEGFVENVGFGKYYRPSGWTPLLVNLKSTIGDAAEYQIQVRQEDLDRDRVVYRRDIVLNAGKQEQFWVYFMVQPIGLGDGSAADADKRLGVWLCTKGGKPLAKLQLRDKLTNIDPGAQTFGSRRGVKLILMVTDGSSSRSAPAMRDFASAIGINEDVLAQLVTPFELPENSIGYDEVDAVVWLDADGSKMTAGGSRRLAALTEWVRTGGRLVVSQSAELFKLEEMASLLPIELKSAAGDWQVQFRDREKLYPIRELAEYHTRKVDLLADRLKRDQRTNWDLLEKERGPFSFAHAKRREGAIGEYWIDWKGDSSDMSPWIARRALGMGSVTWVAQELGNPAITGPKTSGWPYVWDFVLGQRNIDMRVAEEADGSKDYAEDARNLYYTTNSVDLGAELLEGMEHTGRAGGLIFLAGVFFVGYWVVAGPVSYLVLAGKKRTELSWGIFAVSALVATLMTVGVVRLVLRGDPEVHHVSLVRMMPEGKLEDGTPFSSAIISSRIGLYIPRDGTQTVKLLENDPAGVSYITPFSIHPAHLASTTDFPAYLEYDVPVRDNPLTEAVAVGFPYRSTLKKLQAQWVGKLNGGIDVQTGGGVGNYDQNKPKLIEPKDGWISGRLVNRVGVDLAHVYFAFHMPPIFEGGPEFDYVLYKPTWVNGQPIDLRLEFTSAAPLATSSSDTVGALPVSGSSNKRSIRDDITKWAANWYSGLHTTSMGDRAGDFRNEYLHAFPMLSFYDRVPPEKNQPGKSDRIEVLRRAARDWDVSELVAAGQLVIIAQAGKPGATSGVSPLPFKMEVDGDLTKGSGTTFYQIALPLDRTELPPPWTKPDSETPATTRTSSK